MNVLLIDDDPDSRCSLRLLLESFQHDIMEADCGARAKQFLGQTDFDFAFLELRLGGGSGGLELLTELLQIAPDLNVVVLTADPTVETAVEAMRRGAFDYLDRPFTAQQLRRILDRSIPAHRLQPQLEALEQQVRASSPEAHLQTKDAVMRRLLEMAFKVAASEATVLLRGESGTGKGVLARMIHARSGRAAGPFVTMHCPSLSAGLLQSELFGHVRGAFTGAVHDTMGKVTAANGGTLFLDEIGELPSALQPQLLRLLQENRYERMGDLQPRECDIRLLAASNRDLTAAVAGGKFREDLLYRLNVIEIILPPLRERPADIPVLANHLLQFFSQQSSKPVFGFTPEALSAIQSYRWPGNVRELRNAIERAVILATASMVGVADLPNQVRAALSRALV